MIRKGKYRVIWILYFFLLNEPNYSLANHALNIHIKPEIVRKKLKELNPNKSPGYDKCHPHLLKELADEICSPLATLYNKSLKEGAHETWRKAVITPMYKKYQRSDPGNYRQSASLLLFLN